MHRYIWFSNLAGNFLRFSLKFYHLKLAKLSTNDISSHFTCITYINLQLQITMVIYYTSELKDQMSDCKNQIFLSFLTLVY